TQDGKDVGARSKGERDLRESRNRLRGTCRTVDAVVSRGEQPHLVTCPMQVTGERARDIREPAGLGEWLHFRGEHADRYLLLHGRTAMSGVNRQVMMPPCGGS